VLGKRDVPSFHVSQVPLRKQSYRARARKLPPQFRHRRSRFPQIFNPREVINEPVASMRRAKSNPRVAEEKRFFRSRTKTSEVSASLDFRDFICANKNRKARCEIGIKL